MKEWFARFASACAYWIGHPVAFVAACVACVAWGVCGPFFDYSDTWQLIANTSTTIVTFLMLFVIQHTQNRDTLATRVQLDELIRAVEGARNWFAGIDTKSEEELERLRR